MPSFFRKLRGKSRKEKGSKTTESIGRFQDLYIPPYFGPDMSQYLPPQILERIFQEVCPHSRDDSYNTSETQLEYEACMLCDLRDLANCSKVKRQWYPIVMRVLYKNIRIDAVHYCELEEILGEKRKHKHKFDRNGEPPDIPAIRLQLLARTLRDNPSIADQVENLKLAYTLRQTSRADLARTVSQCQNLRYVDLPDTVYTGMETTLTTELMARCPNLRKMRFERGGEAIFEQLAKSQVWPNLEVLELKRLRIEPQLLRRVLGNLPNLRDLKLEGLPCLNDQLFTQATTLPAFPATSTFTIVDAQKLTHEGLATYFANSSARRDLKSLTLTDTSIRTDELHRVLAEALSLESLGYTASVSEPLQPLGQQTQAPSLSSRKLKTLQFEVTTSPRAETSLEPPSRSHYAYLATSLTSHQLPALRSLFVRDPSFPELLTLSAPLPAPGFAGFAEPPGGATGPGIPGLNQPLAIYTKGLDEFDWVYTAYEPSPTPGRPGSTHGGRPSSFINATQGLGPQWGGQQRRSIIVGNGFGGYLAVPVDGSTDGRPRSSGGASMGGGGGRASFGGSSGSGGGTSLWGGSQGAWEKQHSKSGSFGGMRSSFFGHERRGSKASQRDLWR